LQRPVLLLVAATVYKVLKCGKLTPGVTVPQWSSILMLRNLKSPETYFQAAFRVQSPWSIKIPNGDNPNEEEILKPVCFVFDFSPTRALRQISEYAIGLSPAHRRREGVQVQTPACPGEADQVRDAHPGIHVPDRALRHCGCDGSIGASKREKPPPSD